MLHGGTGISDEQFQRAISLGVRKINIATASFDSLASYAKAYCDNKEKPIILSSPPVRLMEFIKMLKDILKFSIWNN